MPLWLLGIVAGCSALCVLSQSLGPKVPDFEYADGWLGADGAYSIALSPGKSLWLFGDTFVSEKGAKLRSEAEAMVRNSVGISDCEAVHSCTIKYFWQARAGAKARSFFDTGKEDVWYWPLDGISEGKSLYLSLLIVRTKPGAKPDEPFGFEIAGTKLVSIADRRKSPDAWQVSMKDLTDSRLWAGVSIVRDGRFAIWYTQVSTGEGKGFMVAMRTPLDKLRDPSGSWEYLRKDNHWVAGLPGEDAYHLIEQAISEMSVRYHPAIKKWIALSAGPEFPSSRAVVRVADSPVGPWSPPQTIYEFPEMKRENPRYDKDTFCYAVKEHVEFADRKIAMTYACNSMVLEKTVANMNIYRPRVVILDLPK